MTTASSFVPLVEITRGDLVESLHIGALAVVDVDGNLVASQGDPQLVTFLRSSSKPFQALPLIEQGGAETFGLSDQEISIMCASHEGTDLHVEVVRSIQEKVGLSESDLLCGTHPVSNKETARTMILRNEEPSPIRHNCSGKHTGFLAQAVLRHLTKENYIDPQHPVQQTVIETFAEMCKVDPKAIHIGIDGCSAPVFGIPLVNAALGFARLCDPGHLAPKRAKACRKITSAMTGYPVMVSGEGKFDTELMRAGNGKIVVKGGAEGFQAIGLLPGACGENSPAMGIVYKIADGDLTVRARPIVGLEILRQLGALSTEQQHLLTEFDRRPVTNWRKFQVGEIRPCFTLNLA